MNQPPRKLPLTRILSRLFIGTIAVFITFWIYDNRLSSPAAWIIIIISLAVFFITFTWALLIFLRWRDERHAIMYRNANSYQPPRPELKGTVYALEPGRAYQVQRSFTDFYGNSFQRNEVLHFKGRHFLPYEGGHTIVFEEHSLYLQQDKNRDILENFSEYILEIK